MSSLWNRRAQNAAGTAVLVAAIAALIIVYILFLSPEDRADLLGEGGGDQGVFPGGDTEGGLTNPVTVLRENIGMISVARSNTIEHTIPSTKILTQVNADEIKRIEALYVKRGAFEEKTKSIKFTMDGAITHNLLLSFNVKTASGRLIILLNGEEIFNKKVTESSPKPIPLDMDYLDIENELVFMVSSPGGAFWKINEYQLENILISADIVDYSRSFAEQHFSMSENEYQNIENAELKYTPNCQPGANAPLSVVLNSQIIFSGLPLCNAVNRIETAKEILIQGDNALTFQSQQGIYEINNVKLKTTLKQAVDPTYYFDIPPNLYEYVDRRKADVFVLLRFTDPDTVKQGTITVNGHKAHFKTNGAYYHTRISSYAQDGSNSIKITPDSDSLEITELRVDVA
ncbi:MAG: hypothetical protein KKG59_06870 [Nanoarchaeota archaeon]|nr:hypothetical protein [Nanoarchaeota archaeon]